MYESKTEWIPVVIIERTVCSGAGYTGAIGESSTKTAIDISGYGTPDVTEIMQAFLDATEGEICSQDT